MDVQLKVVQGKPLGHCLRFGPGEFVFGRGQECHRRLNSELVSRQHCILKVAANGLLTIRDLGSANGTLVNGKRVVGERLLENGDRLQVGPFFLQVVAVPAKTPSTSETSFATLEDTATNLPAKRS